MSTWPRALRGSGADGTAHAAAATTMQTMDPKTHLLILVVHSAFCSAALRNAQAMETDGLQSSSEDVGPVVPHHGPMENDALMTSGVDVTSGVIVAGDVEELSSSSKSGI